MERKTEEKGITLIALVITIIVLLILVGVSISLVVGENGILKKAESAVTETNKSKLEEEVQMLLADWQTDYLVNKIPYDGRNETTASGAVVTGIGDSILVVNGSEIYTAQLSNGQVGELTKEDLGEDSQAYKATHPTAPTGFTHTTGEWNTGYVIKETSTGDEFVWIPVISEASYIKKVGRNNWHLTDLNSNDCNKDDNAIMSLLKGEDYSSNEWVKSEETEKSLVNTAGGFYVSRYEIGIDSVERTTGTQADVRTNSTKYYSQAGKEPARRISQVDSIKIANNWKTGSDVQSGLITGTQWDTMCNFIGWSICDNASTSRANHVNNVSKENMRVWHSGIIYNTINESDCWYNTAITKTNEQRAVFATGGFESEEGDTAQKNIYDVTGNVWEWTTEILNRTEDDGTNRHVVRGGSAGDDTTNSFASSRYGRYANAEEYWAVGFRAVLYVK